MNNKLKSCSFVKTVLMLIIVLYHSILFWGGNWFSAVEAEFVAPLHYLSQWFGTFHIYGFVLVSGYIFGFLKVEQGKYSSFPKFAINKFFRLIVPYAFISVCWVIPIGWFFFKYDFTTVLENYILAINPSQLWFLVMLFVVFLIVWPLTNFFENHNLLSFLLAVTLYLLAIIASSFIPNVFQVLSAFKYVVFFLIGLKLRQLDRKKKLSPTPLLTLILLVFQIMLFALTLYLKQIDVSVVKIMYIALDFLVKVLGAVTVFYGLQYISSKINIEGRILKVLSRNSMTIYLIHQQIIYFTIYFMNGKLNPYVHGVFNFALSLFLSILISELLRKFKATRFLLGERKQES